MKKEWMINLETKEVQVYNAHLMFTTKDVYTKCATGYIILSKKTQLGLEFLDKSKKGLKYIGYHALPNYDEYVYLIYTNDGKTLLKEFHTYCGFDRGPKLVGLIQRLFDELKGKNYDE